MLESIAADAAMATNAYGAGTPSDQSQVSSLGSRNAKAATGATSAQIKSYGAIRTLVRFRDVGEKRPITHSQSWPGIPLAREPSPLSRLAVD